MNTIYTIETGNGPVELTPKSAQLNAEITELRDFVRAQIRRAAGATSFEKLEEIVVAAAENIAYLGQLERELAEENSN